MIRSFLVGCFLLLCTLNSWGQINAEHISMQIEKHLSYDQKNIISTVVKLKNTSTVDFKGFIRLSPPQGIKPIAGDSIPAFVPANDSTFLPIRFIETGSTPAGRQNVQFRLYDEKQRVIRQQNTSIVIQDNNTLQLNLETPTLYLTNNTDSLRIKLTVANQGNKNQLITIVYGLVNNNGQKYYIEQQKTVPLKTTVTFSQAFIPNNHLLKNTTTVLSVTAMRGTQKDIIDNTSVIVQNLSSDKRFTPSLDFNFFASSQHTLTAIYRTVGVNSTIFQIIGNNDYNLDKGSLNLKGNIYKANNNNDFVATNSSATYSLNQNSISIGNISEMLEYSIFGRGISGLIQNKDMDKSLKVGIVDGDFNLFSTSPLNTYGYSTYAIGTFGQVESNKWTQTDVLYRESPYENAKHIIAGAQQNWVLGTQWKINVQLHGGYTQQKGSNLSKPSFASGFQYNGNLKHWQLSGNYYLSSDYYPGNRRGNAQIFQMVTRSFQNGSSYWGNLNYMLLAPKFLHYTSDSHNQNSIGNLGYTFPKMGLVGLGIGYQNQAEKSNIYENYNETIGRNTFSSSQSHRGVLIFSLNSRDYKHMFNVRTESGISHNTLNPDSTFIQTRINSNYSYKWLGISSIYQKGSFFLSEYYSSRMYGKDFQRLSVNLNFFKNFFDEKFATNIGLGYTKDYVLGNTPSALLNLKYTSRSKWDAIANINWYQYQMISAPKNNLLSVELGVTYHFASRFVSSAKKGKVTIFMYLDRNANGYYDLADIPAKGYYVSVGNESFITDNDGRAFYNKVPYQAYEIKPISENGWFYDGGAVVVNSPQNRVEIGLQQMGSFNGSILYSFDSAKAMQFEPKEEGIYFIITKNGQLVKRISTNDSGKFQDFLNTGKYLIELDTKTLPENTYCNETLQEFEIQSGKIIALKPFEILVKNRQVNIKRFGD